MFGTPKLSSPNDAIGSPVTKAATAAALPWRSNRQPFFVGTTGLLLELSSNFASFMENSHNGDRIIKLNVKQKVGKPRNLAMAKPFNPKPLRLSC
jgi:hypothetical protein